MASSTRIQTESWLKTIEVNGGKVIDIGGAELPVSRRNRLGKWNPDEYKILDLEEPHEDNAKVDIVFDLSMEEDELTVYDELFEYFDIAFAIEVYEHCWNPIQALSSTNDFLKPGGILYATFPFIYPHHNPPEQDYLRYTKWGCEKILKETGFEILEMKNRHSTAGMLLGYYGLEQMRPSKKTKENFHELHEATAWMVKAKKL